MASRNQSEKLSVRKSLTRERLCSVLHYDPLTGLFINKRNQAAAKIGGVAGTKNERYVHIFVDGISYLAHRLAWFYVHGSWPDNDIDHENGDGCDNRIANLREATVSQNMVNSGAQKHSKTGLRGIHIHGCGKYRVQLQKDGKSIHVGYFSDIGDAISARDKVYREVHGEFARLDRRAGQ